MGTLGSAKGKSASPLSFVGTLISLQEGGPGLAECEGCERGSSQGNHLREVCQRQGFSPQRERRGGAASSRFLCLPLMVPGEGRSLMLKIWQHTLSFPCWRSWGLWQLSAGGPGPPGVSVPPFTPGSCGFPFPTGSASCSVEWLPNPGDYFFICISKILF